MPFALIDNHVKLSYQDSGAPHSKDSIYTTLVVTHGFGWNSHILSRLLPLAANSNVRLVLLNRRGYAGSTPFTEEELPATDGDPGTTSAQMDIEMTSESVSAKPSNYSSFLQRRSVELARFLVWFIDNKKIPPRVESTNGTSGGISLLGWSLGNSTTLSLLGFASMLETALVNKLEDYLRKVIIYDPPHHALGFHTPDNAYNPLFDQDLEPEERQPSFAVWVTSYYIHSPDALNFSTPPPKNPLRGLEQRRSDPSKPPTLTKLTPKDVQVGLETVGPTHGDEISLVEKNSRVVHEQVWKHAVFGDQSDMSDDIVPLSNVRISYIWNTQSVWETVLSARALMDEVASSLQPPVRPVKLFALEGNHYAHWDDPSRTLAAFVAALE